MRKSRKFNKSKEWLIEQYVKLNRSRKEIAAECGLTIAGLKSVLLKYKILKEPFKVTKEELECLITQKLSVNEICEKLNCSKTSIYKRLRKYNLTVLAEPKLHEQYDSSNDKVRSL